MKSFLKINRRNSALDSLDSTLKVTIRDTKRVELTEIANASMQQVNEKDGKKKSQLDGGGCAPKTILHSFTSRLLSFSLLG